MAKKRVSRRYYEQRRSIGYNVSDLEVRELRPWAQKAISWLIIATGVLIIAGAIGALWALTEGKSIAGGFGAGVGIAIAVYAINLALAIVFGAIYLIFVLVSELIKFALFK